MCSDLLQDAMKKAIMLCGELPAQVVFYSDGAQYESEQVSMLVSKLGTTSLVVLHAPYRMLSGEVYQRASSVEVHIALVGDAMQPARQR